MDTSREKTVVSFSFFFGQEDYLHDHSKMSTVLSSRFRDLFELKSINVGEFKYAQLGATGGTGGLLSMLAEIYHNHTLVFGLVAKFPAFIKAIKGSVKLYSNIRQTIATRHWKKYQKAHNYDHHIDVYLQAWVMSHGADAFTVKRSVFQALNQMMLLFPEMIREVNAVYPDYIVRLNLVVLSKQGSDYIVELLNKFTENDHRDKVLRLMDKQPDTNFPIRITIEQSRFGRKVTILPKLELLKYFHNLMETK